MMEEKLSWELLKMFEEQKQELLQKVFSPWTNAELQIFGHSIFLFVFKLEKSNGIELKWFKASQNQFWFEKHLHFKENLSLETRTFHSHN